MSKNSQSTQSAETAVASKPIQIDPRLVNASEIREQRRIQDNIAKHRGDLHDWLATEETAPLLMGALSASQVNGMVSPKKFVAAFPELLDRVESGLFYDPDSTSSESRQLAGFVTRQVKGVASKQIADTTKTKDQIDQADRIEAVQYFVAQSGVGLDLAPAPHETASNMYSYLLSCLK